MIGFQIKQRTRKVDADTVSKFSILPVANISDSMSRMTAGTTCSFALCAARQRRSPPMISNISPGGKPGAGRSSPSHRGAASAPSAKRILVASRDHGRDELLARLG